MAGLKLNTQAAPQGAGAPKPVPAAARPGPSAQAGPSAPGAPNPPQAPSSSTPHPQGQARPPRPPQAAASPAAASKTTTAAAATTAVQPSSQPRPQPPSQQPQQATPPSAPAATPADDLGPPPVSPITPPLHPLKSTTPIPPPTIPPNFASLGASGGRAPPLTHASHPAAVPSAPAPPIAAAHAPPDPVDFEDNADVIALRATVGILLQQRRRAEEDLRRLRDAKSAAIERPLEFVRDLTGGRVGQGGGGGAASVGKEPHEESSDEEEEDEDAGVAGGDVEMKDEDDGGEDSKPVSRLKPSAMKVKTSQKGKAKASGSSGSSGSAAPAAPPWADLPKPQDIARCPPINWSQYAVQGEVLDRLHSEQLSRPTLGTPARLGANGTYQFTGAPNPDDGKKVEGISAPFNPLRDKIVEKKPPRAGASRRGA